MAQGQLRIGKSSDVVGAASSMTVSVLNSWLSVVALRRKEEPAKALLRQMLGTNLEWRRLSTLANVIGADKTTTTRLLLEIGARGSETSGDDWTLLSRNPLPTAYPCTQEPNAP